MTIKEVKVGKPFTYNGTVYVIEKSDDYYYIMENNGRYVANIEYIGTRFIKAYTYVMGKKVNICFHINDCTLSKSKSYIDRIDKTI